MQRLTEIGNNAWLQANQVRVNKVLQLCDESSFRGDFSSLPLQTIIQLLTGSCNEIGKLQKEVDRCNNLMNQKEKYVDTITEKK